MKLISNKGWVVTLLIISISHVYSQSLEELIRIGLENNYQLQLVKNEAAIAKNNNTDGNAGQLPTVDLTGSASTSLNNTRQLFADGTVREGSNASTSNINMALMANWTAFNGFSVWARKDQLGYLEELGAVNARFYLEQTVADIAMAYYQLKYEYEVLSNFEESMSISAYRLAIEKKKREVGAGSGISYHQAVVDYQTDSMRVLNQHSMIKTLQIEINRLLVNDPENEWTVNDTILIDSLPEKNSLQEMATSHNQLLAQSKLEELITETEVRIQQASRYPKVDLFAGFQYNRSLAEVGFVNSNRNLGPTAGVTISFNLFNGGNTNRLIKNSKLESESATISRKQTENNISTDVLKLYYQYKSVLDRIALAESNLKAAQKVYAIAKDQLKQGAINGYDFRQSQLTLLASELMHAQVYFELKSIEVNLKRLTGQILEGYIQ